MGMISELFDEDNPIVKRVKSKIIMIVHADGRVDKGLEKIAELFEKAYVGKN